MGFAALASSRVSDFESHLKPTLYFNSPGDQGSLLPQAYLRHPLLLSLCPEGPLCEQWGERAVHASHWVWAGQAEVGQGGSNDPRGLC